MSKTVKTIGLLGLALLAMLGTTAEAHYTYARGTYYYHSVGCDVTIGSVAYPPDRLEVKCQVDATQVELLCPGNVTQILNFGNSQLRLVADAQLDPGETRVEVDVDDSPLLDSPLLMTCDGSQPPLNVLIHSMVAKVTISKCASLVECLVPLVTETAVTGCVLPAQFNFDNLPPDYTEYTCTAPFKVHVY